MSLLKGTFTGCRYKVDGQVNHMTKMIRMIQEGAFAAPPGRTRGTSVGWARSDNFLETDFDDTSMWIFGPWRVFVLRIEKTNVPATLVKAHANKQIKTWCKEHERERCPRIIRREIEDQILQDLLPKSLPKTSAIEVAWNEVEQRLWFASTAESANDRFRQLFKSTFGLEITPLEEKTFAAEFYLWLWWLTEHAEGVATLEDMEPATVWIWIEDLLSFCSPGDTDNKVVLTGDKAPTSPESRTALRDGKLPRAIKLGLRQEDTEFAVTLREDGTNFNSAKLPKTETKNDEAHVYERLGLVDRLASILDGMFKHFISKRLAKDWPPRALTEWVGSHEDAA